MNNLFNFNLMASKPFVELPEAEIFDVSEVQRPDGYCLPGLRNFHAKAKIGSLVAEGWGSGSESVAKSKAISEALERLALFTSVQGGNISESSNGWAAHFDEELAYQGALCELVERSTALQSWFEQGAYYELPKILFPNEISLWKMRSESLEFGEIQILITLGDFGPCATVILSRSGRRVVTGHAFSPLLKDCILSAFYEAIRSAHSALRFDSFGDVIRIHKSADSSFSPNANALAYAYHVSLPKMNIKKSTELEIQAIWEVGLRRIKSLLPKLKVQRFKINDRYVVSLSADELLKMFWGPTPAEMNVKNKMPHFVG